MGDFQACLVGQADVLKLLPEAHSTWGISMNPEQFLSYWLQAEDGVDQRMFEFLKRLKQSGYNCFLATNQEQNRFSYLQRTLNLHALFDGLYSSHALGVKKPDPVFYERMLADIPHAERSELLFGDDTPANVEGARNAGIQAEYYSSPEEFVEKMKNYVFLNPRD